MGTYDRTRAYCMFAGELNGDIVLAHLAPRAREVRHSIAEVCGHKWPRPLKMGWRVIPVVVQDRAMWLKRERG